MIDQFDGSEEIPEELRHFGLRIEDTLLYVDTKSIDILTRDTPRVDLYQQYWCIDSFIYIVVLLVFYYYLLFV